MNHSYSLTDLKSIPIFFIVGKGRSGTTLLSTILDSHTEVASATESRFLLMVWQKYKGLKVWKPEMAQEFYETVLSDFRVEYHWEFEENFVSELKKLPTETKVQELIKMVYIFKKSLFEKDKIKYIIDKNPRYTLFVDLIHEIFNNAKFIRIIRDPRDNVTSSIKYNKSKCDAIGFKWTKYNQLLDKFEKKGRPITTMKFENLVLDKATFFENFEAFTGIDSLLSVEHKRLNIKDQFVEKLSDAHKKQHAASVKPMDKSKIGHYKQKLNINQISKVESVSFPYAEVFGYTTENKIVTLPFKRLLRLKFRFIYNLYANRIVYNLPYSMMIKARSFVLKYILKNKLNRYKNMSVEK